MWLSRLKLDLVSLEGGKAIVASGQPAECCKFIPKIVLISENESDINVRKCPHPEIVLNNRILLWIIKSFFIYPTDNLTKNISCANEVL